MLNLKETDGEDDREIESLIDMLTKVERINRMMKEALSRKGS